MPTLEDRILEHLRAHGASLDDGELAEAIGVGRPVIAETCRQLEARGLVVRNMAGGTRTVTTVAAPARAAAAAEAAPSRAGDPAPDPTADFPAYARRVLSARWGTSLHQRGALLPGGVVHPCEFVSGNGRIVGDVVWLGDRDPVEAKFAAIAEAVLLIGHVANADRRFLVFGQEFDALSRWLTRYRLLLDGVEVWFLEGERLERLA